MGEAGPSTSRPLKRSRSSSKSKSSKAAADAGAAQNDVASAGVEQEEDGPEVEMDAEEEAESSNAAALAKERKAKKARKAKADASTPGVVYISRLPPGMTPQKVRHLMAKWGDVGKVYAQRRDAPTGYNPNSSTQKKPKHQRADFTEAWVEFLSKSVAKMVAQMLNAQMIGGRKGDKWRDDIWTMRYLSGFKWEMLGEQIAYERQAHQARLRNEISRSKTEQGEYLRNVELARVLEKRKQKRIAAGGDGSIPENAAKAAASGKEGDDGKKQGYRQRQAEDGARGMKDVGMAGVLGSVFG